MRIREHTNEIVIVGTTLKRHEVLTLMRVNLNVRNEASSNLAIGPDSHAASPRLFDNVARTTIGERFPFLTCFAVCFGLLASALITEIECLKGSGYFWR